MLHSSQTLCTTVAESLEENEGKNILIIADGWDELSEAMQSEGSFLYELLFEDLLPFASVMVTSRPSASAKFHTLPCIDRFIEVTGFNKENITDYIESEFPNDWGKAARLREQIHQNTFVESMCIVPLNCAIVCHLWRTLEEELPRTMTELYTKIICNIILRSIRKNGFENMMSLPSLDALPNELKPSWQLLCQLAFQAIERDQIVFTQQELDNLLPACHEKIFCFGLLQSSQSILLDGCGVSFHFLHLTIQEYLAALHLVKLLPVEYTEAGVANPPITFVKIKQGRKKPVKLRLPERFYIVWRFLFGIFFNIFKCSDYRIVQPHLQCTDNYVVLCHCAFEAKNKLFDNRVIELLKAGKSRSIIRLTGSSAYDSDAIIHVIDKVEECGNLTLNLENCNLREEQIIRLTDALANKYGKLKVAELTLEGNNLNESSVYTLLLRASDALQSLADLNLGNNRIGADIDREFIPQKPSFENVAMLNLSDNPLGVSGVQKLQSAISLGSFKNLSLLELKNTLTSDADTNASLLDSLLEVLISAHCPLRGLSLSHNNLGVPGASVLARMISKHHKIMSGQHDWLCELRIDETQLSDAGLCSFIKMLECQHKFRIFFLWGNNLHAAGITLLADAVCSEKIELNCSVLLPNAALGLEGAIAIGRILSNSHSYLSDVNLSGCQLTTVVESSTTSSSHPISCEDVGQQLCQLPRLQKNPFVEPFTQVERMFLDKNNFDDNRIQILAGFMYLCSGLRKLSTKDCAITSKDLVCLIDKLEQFNSPSDKFCSRLSTWNLHNNKIDDNGIVALMQCQLFPRMHSANQDGAHILYGVTLSANPVSDEMVKMLDEELKKQSRVRLLKIYRS